MTGREGVQERASPPASWGLLHLLGQYLKFGVVGLAATAVHVAVFTLLIELFAVRPLRANLGAFCVAVVVSYLGNFHWTFRTDPAVQGERRRMSGTFARFVAVALTGLALNSLMVYLAVDLLGLHYGYAILLMIGVVPVIVFTLNKLWAFRPTRPY